VRRAGLDLGGLSAAETKILKQEMAAIGARNPLMSFGISMLGLYDPDNGKEATPEINRRRATSITAKIGVIAAYFHRARNGKSLPPVRDDLTEAEHFLYLMCGEPQSKEASDTLDVAFILHADHGMNASTFSARVTISTLSDFYSAITAAIGTLKGPLHGGANEEAMKSFEEVGKPENAEAYVRDRLERHEKIFGFGHAVYKTYDPRATVLKRLSQEACDRAGKAQLHEIAEAIAPAPSRMQISSS
jgi:citrate synthase